ncbi:MAG TPA: glycosyltransferase family 4 protein [Chthonomonadaceae bacterium]|nr:glycosyltransferase family 4 protein [Chthonomonadaceae bacterium]
MRAWLITVGEPLPTDGPDERLLRTGILANLLASRGHRVVWWTSTFDHMRKRQRFPQDTVVDRDANLRIVLLHAGAYRQNVSLRRILNHRGVARKFSRLARHEPPPDVILCSLPTLELCLAATAYGRQHGIPVILDIRDLWPDIFLELAPAWGQGAARALLAPMYGMARTACRDATALVGLTPEFIAWGTRLAGRPRSPLDRDFAMGYTQAAPGPQEQARAEAFWAKQGLCPNSGEFIACFFGTFGRQFDLETVIEAARRLQGSGRAFRFVLCGKGDNLEHYRRLAQECGNVLFPGWVGAPEIWMLMRLAAVGLAPYRNSFNFTANLPNKPIEYLSAGLPILSSLSEGILKNLLDAHGGGFTYTDAASLATILRDLYDHPERREACSEQALALYRERFIGERVYGEMAAYLEELAHPTQARNEANAAQRT